MQANHYRAQQSIRSQKALDTLLAITRQQAIETATQRWCLKQTETTPWCIHAHLRGLRFLVLDPHILTGIPQGTPRETGRASVILVYIEPGFKRLLPPTNGSGGDG